MSPSPFQARTLEDPRARGHYVTKVFEPNAYEVNPRPHAAIRTLPGPSASRIVARIGWKSLRESYTEKASDAHKFAAISVVAPSPIGTHARTVTPRDVRVEVAQKDEASVLARPGESPPQSMPKGGTLALRAPILRGIRTYHYVVPARS